MGGDSTHLPGLKPEPVLRLHLNELSHPATAAFLSLVDGSRLLDNAIKNVLRHLYQPLKEPQVPPVRSVTLVLRTMDGVAYTTGTELDNDHKEIHFNLDYIENSIKTPERCRDEIIGVVTHEMVHCYQYNCQGTAPGGLIEGIADFVRLRSGLAPPHWKGPKSTLSPTSKTKDSKVAEPKASQVPGPDDSQAEAAEKSKEPEEDDDDRWDAGYQKTAYFLDWLEQKYGHGSIARMNETMRTAKYEEKEFWTGLFGKEQYVQVLWKKYRKSVTEGGAASNTTSTASRFEPTQ